MEVFFILFFVWLIVTLVGHASWVITSVFVRAIVDRGDEPSNVSKGGKPSSSEFDSTRKVVRHLSEQGHLSESQRTELIVALRDAQYYGKPQKIVNAESQEEIDPFGPKTVEPSSDAPLASIQNREVQRPGSSEVQRPVTGERIKESIEAGDELSDKQPIPPAVTADTAASPGESSEIVDAVLVEEAIDPLAEQIVPTVPDDDKKRRTGISETNKAPALSRSEVIQAFLSTHNIRWGEIVAGILIVVCSIGLVRTLWNPLVSTHPLIPSVIFLAANAAITATGLYTLKRWRLRHTSRAVLVISTLLIPLSVLAGIAAVRKESDLLSTSDPLTLVFIAVASILYGRLAYESIKALTRRAYGKVLTFAYAIPIALLPFIKVSVTNFESNAGWLILLASLSIGFTADFIVNSCGRHSKRLGPSLSRIHVLFLGFGLYACGVLGTYFVFSLRIIDGVKYLPLAVGLIPALIGYAAVAGDLRKRSVKPTFSFLGLNGLVILTVPSFLILVPAAVSSSWLWIWAAVLTVSLVWATIRSSQPEWSCLIAIPLGVTSILTAEDWTLFETSGSDSLWIRFLSAEAFLVTIGVSGILSLWLSADQSRDRRLWITRSLIAWLTLSLLIACSLVLLPASFLGSFPWWGLSVVLGITMAGITAGSYSERLKEANVVLASLPATGLFWLSIFKPENWFDLSAITPFTWALLCTGFSVLAAEKISEYVQTKTTKKLLSIKHSTRILAVDGVVCLVTLCGISRMLLGDFQVVAVLLSATTLMLLSALHSHALSRLVFAQVISILCAAVVVYLKVPLNFFAVEHWISGSVHWLFAIPCLSLVGVWVMIREMIVFSSRWMGYDASVSNVEETGSKVRSVNNDPNFWNALAINQSEGAVLTEVCLLGISIIFGYFGIFTGITQSLLSLEMVVPEPTAVWQGFLTVASLLSLNLLIKRYTNHSIWRQQYFITTSFLFAVCSSSLVCAQFLTPEQGRLYLASVVSVSLLLLSGIHYFFFGSRDHQWTVPFRNGIEIIALLCLGVLSARFLAIDWVLQITNGREPFVFTSVIVFAWSLLGSLWFRLGSSGFPKLLARLLSLLLFCCCFVIALPFMGDPQMLAYVQAVGIASIIWGMTYALNEGEPSDSSDEGADSLVVGALSFGIAVGMGTSIATTLCVFVGFPGFYAGSEGFLISLLSSMILVTGKGHAVLSRWIPSKEKLITSWPIGVSLLAGQIAWLLVMILGVNSANEPIVNEEMQRICVALVWVITAALAFLRNRTSVDLLSRIHIVGVSLLTPLIWFLMYRQELTFGILSLASVVLSGLLIRQLSRTVETVVGVTLGRTLSWWVFVSGTALICEIWLPMQTMEAIAGVYAIWTVGWLIAWHLPLTVGQKKDVQTLARPPAVPHASALVTLGILATVELVGSIWGRYMGTPSMMESGYSLLHLLKWISYGVVTFSVILRPRKDVSWFFSYYQLTVVVAFAAVSISRYWQPNSIERVVLIATTASILNAMLSHWCVPLARMIANGTDTAIETIHASVRALLTMVCLIALGSVLSVFFVMAEGSDLPVSRLLIASLAVCGWAMAQCAGILNRESLRKLTVATMLSVVALWISFDLDIQSLSVLKGSMRWLVVSVLLLPATIFILPKLLGSKAEVWNASLRWCAGIVTCTSVLSLGVMFFLEMMARTDTGLEGVSSIEIVFVALVLGALAVLSAVIGIITGPTFSFKNRLPLMDSQREIAIYGAQVLVGCIWVHLCLCRPDWVYTELREKWYYFVMGVAFLSVGVTEIARRIGDDVLLRVFQRTAFLLPIIPLIGFWMTSHQWIDGVFSSGNVIRYDVLLLIGAIYYGVVSYLWKHSGSRVISIGLGNVAWWFLLTQTPGWAFVEHPQLWLIPPAFCVLFAVGIYRDSIDKQTVAFIRYAAMLTIYISSTADMLIQEIGESIMGPIFLILLSLVGMLAGVILRVRAFLFLGACFIFLGTMSMVWHANRSLGSSWPWWVFGITTGILLLTGLMVLEKYKKQLRKYSEALAKWDA